MKSLEEMLTSMDTSPECVYDPWEEVFEKWGKAVSPLVGDDGYTAEAISTVAKTPFARLLLNNALTADQDLSGNECAVRPSFTVESFASGTHALTTARAIDARSHAAMVAMGYRRSYGPTLIENIDNKIKRIVSRYVSLYTGN